MSGLTYTIVSKPLCYFMSAPAAVEARIMNFTSLEKGWHYGRGAVPSMELATFALRVVSQLRSLGISKFEAFPTVDGEILVSAYQGDVCIDALVTAAQAINLVVERGGEEVFARDQMSSSELIETIGGKGWLSDASLDWYIPAIIVMNSNASSHWPSMPPMMTTAFPLYLSVVSKTAEMTYAEISADITRHRSPASRQYSGALTNRHSLPAA